MATRQQLEQQLVAAHRSGNVQAAQQAAYAIRQYDQSALSAQIPSINAPPPIERVPKPTFGSWLENVGIGIGEGLGEQVQGIGELAQRGASALGAYAKDPLKASAAAFMGALAPAMRGFTQPAQVAKDVGAGVVETGKQMYQQATSGPVGLGTVIGQNLDLPGPGGQRRPTMAELDVYHGTPHTFEPEEGAPLGRFRSSKIGTGEGAQAYGYGLYLAENEKVAGGYRIAPGNTQYTIDGKNALDAAANDETLNRPVRYLQDFSYDVNKGNIKSAMDAAIDDGRPEVAKQIQDLFNAGRIKPAPPGRLYKVDLPDAKIEQMLDWDKPLSEQSENVRNALKRRITDVQPIDKFDMGGGSRLRDNRAGQYDKTKPYPWILEANSGNGTSAFGLTQKDVDRMFGGKDASSLTGEQIISRLAVTQGSQAAASEYLRSLGIPGIKYLDAGSRDGGKGTRNFVVFPGEEQNLTILERDGVKAEVPKPAAPVIDTTKPRREQLRQLHQQSGVSFVDSTIDRGGAHTPAGPTSGSPAYDVALNGTYPEDFYGANGLRYYGTGYDEMDKQAYDKIRRMEGRPNAPVEVYRAVEKNGPKTISPGDWVTTVRDYAKDHGESALNGDYKIIRALVNARDIYTAGDSMLEWGYHPQPRMPQLPKVAK